MYISVFIALQPSSTGMANAVVYKLAFIFIHIVSNLAISHIR